jgi:hypothetical protein
MRSLTILCLMLVATKFGTSLAHVAELPGKLRLDEATYKAVRGLVKKCVNELRRRPSLRS